MGFFEKIGFGKSAESPKRTGPKNEEGEHKEVVPFSEMLEAVSTQLKKLNSSLDDERALSAQIRKMGGVVTQEAAGSIRALENQFNALMKLYEERLQPSTKEAAMALISGQEFVIEKPENFDELMKEPGIVDVTNDDLPEIQTSVELKAKEAQLVSEAEAIENEMIELVDQINTMSDRKDLMPTGLSEDIKKQQIGILRAHFDDLLKSLTGIREDLTGIKLNVGMAKRFEGQDMSTAA